MRDAFIYAAYRNFFYTNQMIARVEQNHAQRFLAKLTHFRADQVVNQVGRIDFLFRQAFASQTLTETESSDELGCLGKTNSRPRRQLMNSAATQAAKGTIIRQQLTRDFDRIGAGNSGSQKNGDQLRIG